MKYFVLLAGPSGVGKNWLEEQIKFRMINNMTIKKLQQITTRAPRSRGELMNNVYLFTNDQFYQKMVDADLLIARANVNGMQYGTIDDTLDDGIYTIIVNAEGYKNVVRDLEERYNHRTDYRIIYIRIAGDIDDTGRINRDQDQEEEDLDKLDLSHVDYDMLFINQHNEYAKDNGKILLNDLESIIATLQNRIVMKY